MITFAPIDAKGTPVIGIKHEAASSLEEKAVLLRARCEYLMALKNLQNSIKLKYEVQLLEITHKTNKFSYEEEKQLEKSIHKEIGFNPKDFDWNCGLYYT